VRVRFFVRFSTTITDNLGRNVWLLLTYNRRKGFARVIAPLLVTRAPYERDVAQAAARSAGAFFAKSTLITFAVIADGFFPVAIIRGTQAFTVTSYVETVTSPGKVLFFKESGRRGPLAKPTATEPQEDP